MKPTLAQINRLYLVAIISSVSIFFFAALLQNDQMAIWVALFSAPYLSWQVSSIQQQTLEYAESLERRVKALEQPTAAEV